MFKATLVVILMLSGSGVLAEEPFDELTSKAEMNGIRLSDYKDFLDWPLVTVRFRRDTEEQRFTYANKLAWESLAKKITDYPDKSVFIKMGYITDNDPAFASSAVPSGGRRIQVMVRNKEKYKSTDGWGYALFKLDGSSVAPNHAQMAMECAACHRLVPERGYVFSQPFDRRFVTKQAPPFVKGTVFDGLMNKASKGAAKAIFVEKPINTIPTKHLSRKLIPGNFKNIRLVEGELRKSAFAGTYVEIVPSLIHETLKTNQPAGLFEDKFKGRFSLAYVMNKDDLPCSEKEKPVYIAMTVAPFYLPWAEQRNSNLEVRQICAKAL